MSHGKSVPREGEMTTAKIRHCTLGKSQTLLTRRLSSCKMGNLWLRQCFANNPSLWNACAKQKSHLGMENVGWSFETHDVLHRTSWQGSRQLDLQPLCSLSIPIHPCSQHYAYAKYKASFSNTKRNQAWGQSSPETETMSPAQMSLGLQLNYSNAKLLMKSWAGRVHLWKVSSAHSDSPGIRRGIEAL